MRKQISRVLIIALALAIVTPAGAFAAENTTTPAASTQAATNSTTPAAVQTPAQPIELSLEAAIETLNDSPQMEIIELQKTADKIVSAGASEGLSRIKEAKAAVAALTEAGIPGTEAQISAIQSSISGTSETDLKVTRDFARKMLEPNDQARRNDLRLQAVKLYYTLKNTEAMVNIAQENYEISKKIYENSQKKFKLGVISKVDLISSELDLAKAKDGFTAAKNGLAQAKMGFNIFYGLPVMQEVKLTSDIATPTLPAITVEQAVSDALNNRNEIAEANHQFEAAEKELSSKSAYPRSSSTYLSAKAGYVSAKTNHDLQPSLVEQNVRGNYMEMTQNYETLSTIQKTVDNAKESLRLVQLQYDNGLVTYTIVQQAQLGYTSALQSQAEAKLNYALAVEKFTYSYGVGLKAASLGGGGM